MVLVFLKNFLFPPQDTRGKRTPISPSTPMMKYGSFQPDHHRPTGLLSVSPETDAMTPQVPCYHREHLEHAENHIDIERGLSTESVNNHAAAEPFATNIEPPSRASSTCFSPRVISDAIIGLSDGLTVPFALTAGLSTFQDTRVVVYGGLAELIAGSISMGLGGWLAARGESEYYDSTVRHTESMIQAYHSTTSSPWTMSLSSQGTKPPIPEQLDEIFRPYHLPSQLHSSLINHLLSPEYPRTHLLSLLIQHHHNLSPVETNRAAISAMTISGGYFFGGFVPLVPYFFVGRHEVLYGLAWSVGVMAICLFLFGAWKTVAMDNGGWEDQGTGEWKSGNTEGHRKKAKQALKGGLEMLMVGGIAAGGAMGIVRFLGGVGE